MNPHKKEKLPQFKSVCNDCNNDCNTFASELWGFFFRASSSCFQILPLPLVILVLHSTGARARLCSATVFHRHHLVKPPPPPPPNPYPGKLCTVNSSPSFSFFFFFAKKERKLQSQQRPEEPGGTLSFGAPELLGVVVPPEQTHDISFAVTRFLFFYAIAFVFFFFSL